MLQPVRIDPVLDSESPEASRRRSIEIVVEVVEQDMLACRPPRVVGHTAIETRIGLHGFHFIGQKACDVLVRQFRKQSDDAVPMGVVRIRANANPNAECPDTTQAFPGSELRRIKDALPGLLERLLRHGNAEFADDFVTQPHEITGARIQQTVPIR